MLPTRFSRRNRRTQQGTTDALRATPDRGRLARPLCVRVRNNGKTDRGNGNTASAMNRLYCSRIDVMKFVKFISTLVTCLVAWFGLLSIYLMLGLIMG